MSSVKFTVDIRAATKPGPVRAYADVRCELPDGAFLLHGFSVIQKDGKPPFVGFPSKPGNNPGKFFPVVEAEGPLRQMLCKIVLDAFSQWNAQQ